MQTPENMSTPLTNEEVNERAQPNSSAKPSVFIKSIFVFIVLIILMIPVLLIDNLVYERMDRHHEVVDEISRKWGQKQKVSAPFLMIPYKYQYKDGKNVKTSERYIFLTPKNINIQSNLEVRKKQRSIYEVLLYNAPMKIEGSFDLSAIEQLNLESGNILWDKAKIIVSMTDPTAISEHPTLQWANQQISLNPKMPDNRYFESGFSINVPLTPKQQYTFHLTLNLRGSEALYFITNAESNKVSVQSDWKAPSFNGAALPEWHSTDTGFEAKWHIIGSHRTFPSAFLDGLEIDWDKNIIGLNIMDVGSQYTKIDRVIKYAFLIVALTFAVILLVDIVKKINLHPIHYLLVGLALIIFYTLLLSFSEFIGFESAYLLATVGITAIIGMYMKGVVKVFKTALTFMLVVLGLYAYVYFLIQLEDMALLFGSLALFFILSITMYLTKNINWYQLSK